jgi:hypothetical protein
VKNKRFCYRNGVVLINTRPNLLQGQVVEVIDENDTSFKVRISINGIVYIVDKKDILVN